MDVQRTSALCGLLGGRAGGGESSSQALNPVRSGAFGGGTEGSGGDASLLFPISGIFAGPCPDPSAGHDTGVLAAPNEP